MRSHFLNSTRIYTEITGDSAQTQSKPQTALLEGGWTFCSLTSISSRDIWNTSLVGFIWQHLRSCFTRCDTSLCHLFADYPCRSLCNQHRNHRKPGLSLVTSTSVGYKRMTQAKEETQLHFTVPSKQLRGDGKREPIKRGRKTQQAVSRAEGAVTS